MPGMKRPAKAIDHKLLHVALLSNSDLLFVGMNIYINPWKGDIQEKKSKSMPLGREYFTKPLLYGKAQCRTFNGPTINKKILAATIHPTERGTRNKSRDMYIRCFSFYGDQAVCDLVTVELVDAFQQR